MSIENPELEQKDLLERETSLTREEINGAKLPMTVGGGFEVYRYNIDGEEVSVYELQAKFKTNFDEQINVPEHTESLNRLYRSEGAFEKGDSHIHERLLVNALVEQLRIAKKFNIPTKSLYRSMKLDLIEEEGAVMMDHQGFVYPFILQKHVESLKKSGATDEQIITEVSGHIFHESLHDIDGELRSVLFDGNKSFGEVTSITGQLAYYLEKGYDGPKGYDVACSQRGQKKIKENKGRSSDHETATAVAAELLLEELRSAYPDIAEKIDAQTSLDVYEQLVSQIPLDKRGALIPALKKAILASTDESNFNETVGRLNESNAEK